MDKGHNRAIQAHTKKPPCFFMREDRNVAIINEILIPISAPLIVHLLGNSCNYLPSEVCENSARNPTSFFLYPIMQGTCYKLPVTAC